MNSRFQYRVTWEDNGEAKSLDVSTAYAAAETMRALQLTPARYSNIQATCTNGRFKELVISFSGVK